MSTTSTFARFAAGRQFGALLVIGLVLAPALPAQVLYGNLVGSVTDSSSGAVPQATITISNAETGRTWQATSNQEGGYTLNTIPPGTYSLKVEAKGFQSFQTSGVALSANSTVRVNAVLQLGSVQQTVEVSASAATLQTDTAEVRNEISNKQIENLPLNVNGNYQSVLLIVPGAAPPADSNSLSGNPSRGLMVNMNGATAASTSIRVDGTTAQNVWLPHVAGYVPTSEAIQTVNVAAGSFDAEQGFAGGAAVNVQIKSGTNALHGSAFENHIDNHLKARPFFYPANQAMPKRIVNTYGGSVGGPIRKDRLFFFASYEARPDRENGNQITSVPTAKMRVGDMSESAPQIYDPATGNPDGTGRTPFANNQIPTSRIAGASAKLMTLMPQPNYSSGSLNNYFASGAFGYDRRTLDTKFNYYVNNKLNVSARVSYLHWNFQQATLFGDLGGTGVDSRGTYPTAVGDTLNMTFSGVYTPTASTVIDAYFGYNLKNDQEEPYRLAEKLGTDYLKIPGTNGPGQVNGGWPGFAVSSYPAFGNPYVNTPGYWHMPSEQYSGSVSRINGNHNLRFGAEIISGYFETLGPAAAAPAGTFTFGPGPTQLAGTSGNQFNSYSTFLLGLPTTMAKDAITNPSGVTSRAFSWYARDRWQASRRLTLSLGVRWDYYPVPTRPNGRGLERYDFSNNNYSICGAGSVSRDCGMTANKRGFEPRVGIAWRATDTFVVRAGYGITYDPVNLARNSHLNYPEITSYSASGVNSFQPVTTLTQGIPDIPAPDYGNGIVQLPKNVAVKLVDPEFKRSYIQSWSLVVQKQLTRDWTAEAGYVATRTIHEQFQWNANYAPIGTGNAGLVLNQRFGRTASTIFLTDLGHATYDGLQTFLERRFARGYQVRFTYTWSKAIGTCCGTTGLDTIPINLPQAFNLLRAPLGFDRTHKFTASGTWELPFGKGQKLATGGVAAKMLGGWRFSGIVSAYTGTPFTVSASGTSLNTPGVSQQADQVKSDVAKLGQVYGWFDPLAFAPVTQTRLGTSGFNILRGPGVINLDSSVVRTFRINERVGLNFRAEALNTTNTPHFGNPGANVSNMQVLSNGTVQLNGYTQITGTANRGTDGMDERFFRLSLKVTF